ncbi:12061_t:CDS:2, partial [Acaulospora morrowiae]
NFLMSIMKYQIKLKLKIEKKSISKIMTFTELRTRTLGNINNLKIMIQGSQIPISLQVVDLTDKIFLLGNDWFERVKAWIYYDKQRLVFKYTEKVIKISISNDIMKRVPADEINIAEESDNNMNKEKITDHILDEIIYKEEQIDEKKGYFVEEIISDLELDQEIWESILGLAAYLSQIKEFSITVDEE